VRFIYILLLVEFTTVFLPTHHLNAQEECECMDVCPNGVEYTACFEEFNGHHAETFDIWIPLLFKSCSIEIHWCCRIRRVGDPSCQQFVTGALGASCETAITCIKIPKPCVADYVGFGQPINDANLRKSIYQAVLKYIICRNPCQHGLPIGTEAPYEWVFSMPACLEYVKTGDPLSAFCLESCGTKTCVYAFKMARTQYDNPRVLEKVITEWSPVDPPTCDANPNCKYNACDEEFDPSCAEWGI
jgi:hypothetical protein